MVFTMARLLLSESERNSWRLAIPVRLLIVDDHEIVRLGVRILLSDTKQWDICGEAQNGVEAVERVVELAPDVVILDLTMPVMSGFDTASRIRRVAPLTRIVFFSIHDTPTTARLAGADGFVSKSSAAAELASTIRRVLATGETQRPLNLHLPD